MRRIILIPLLTFFTCCSYAQGGMYGFEAGAGYGTAYQPHITPTANGYCLKRFTASLYAGGALSFQRYSFYYDLKLPAASAGYGSLLNIRQTSQYLFFTPKLDVGIGYRKYLHAYCMAGPGIYMGGQQTTERKEPFWTTATGGNFGADTISYITTYNIPNVTFRAALGLTERIPTYRYFNIAISEEFSILPTSISKGNPNLQSNYFSFTIGVMHKYPQATIVD